MSTYRSKCHIAWLVGHTPPPTRRAHFERLDVRVFGDTAVATGIAFTDVFVRKDEGQQGVNAQESPVQ
jgi:hypothetical protein